MADFIVLRLSPHLAERYGQERLRQFERRISEAVTDLVGFAPVRFDNEASETVVLVPASYGVIKSVEPVGLAYHLADDEYGLVLHGHEVGRLPGPLNDAIYRARKEPAA